MTINFDYLPEIQNETLTFSITINDFVNIFFITTYYLINKIIDFFLTIIIIKCTLLYLS